MSPNRDFGSRPVVKLRHGTWTLWGIYQVNRFTLVRHSQDSGLQLITESRYECKNIGKVLQRCVTNLLNEFGSIEVVVRPNRDSPNDRGEGVIGDMPLLHMEKSPSFWIEKNDQEE